jgi:phospholipid N-methyltransferase
MHSECDIEAADLRAFVGQWWRQPRTIGAIAPSGTALAEAMVAVAGTFDGPVLELGAGTGVFSRALLRAGVPAQSLTIVERVPEFVDLLRDHAPGARVLACDAAALTPAQFPEPPTCIISGLPLRAMAEDVVEKITAAAFDCAARDARMVQFSYGPRCPLPRSTRRLLRLSASRSAWIWRNLPPAWVWRFDRE